MLENISRERGVYIELPEFDLEDPKFTQSNKYTFFSIGSHSRKIL